MDLPICSPAPSRLRLAVHELISYPYAFQRPLRRIVSGLQHLLVLANKIDLLGPADRACEEVRGWATLARELSLLDVDDVEPFESRLKNLRKSVSEKR